MLFYIQLIIGGVIGTYILVFLAVAFLEKQHLHGFVPAAVGEPTTDSAYFNAMNDAARRLGFTDAGVLVQNRSSRLYQARLAMWVSPEGHILLQVGGGKTANVPVKLTILTAIVEPDRILQTQDGFGSADLSGLTDRKILVNADLDELLACHRGRLAECLGSKRSFAPGTAFADRESIQVMRAERLVRLGLVKFLNREQTVWRRTLKGAWLQYYIGFRSQLAEGKAQAERISKKRPGAT